MQVGWDFEAFVAEEFRVGVEDFGDLEPRVSGKGSLWYFYHTKRHSLIKHFRIYDGPQVVTLMTVTLIEKGEKFEPRIRLWKRKASSVSTAVEESAETYSFIEVKASVDTENGHQNFWRVIEFIRSLQAIDVPRQPFHLVDNDVGEIVNILQSQSKESILSAVRTAIGAQLTDADLMMLAGRKRQLDLFKRLLDPNSDDFAKALERIGAPEKVWQTFFERNQWIFGYGLSLVSCEAFDGETLERITTGANVFTGGGKRIDALLRTRGYVRSLVFAEIKKHSEDLLTTTPYRKPDVYKASNELVGAVAQVQKTADKAIRRLQAQVYQHFGDDGEYTGIEFATIRPRQVVVIGTQAQFESNGALNPERVHSFELYRRSISDVEVLTYDELYERAAYIVRE